MNPWCPGERLTYYAETKEVCDDRGVLVAEVTSDRVGLFIVAAEMLVEWVDNHPDAYRKMCAFTKGDLHDDFFRHISRMRGIVKL